VKRMRGGVVKLCSAAVVVAATTPLFVAGLSEVRNNMFTQLQTQLFPCKNMFRPVTLGELKLQNRFVLASLTRGRAGEARVPNEAMMDYYKARAWNFGLLLAEASSISAEGEGWFDSPSLYGGEERLEGWKKLVTGVHQMNGKIIAQMWHTGRAGHSSFLPEKMAPLSASDVAIEGDGVYTADGSKQAHETPKAMTVEDIQKTVADYKKAAEFCKEAEFDGVEIHAANGYLLDQFLQSCSNKRTDEYGGSLENRYRFLKEVIDAVSRVYEPGRVGIKLSPNGISNGMGSDDNSETFTYVLDQIEALPSKLCYVQVMDGLSFGFHEKCDPVTLDVVKQHLKQTPVMANCGYTPETADEAVGAGKADVVAFGRPTLSNPDFVNRINKGFPLNDDLPLEDWFGTGIHRTNPEKGYTDFPPMYSPPRSRS